MIRHLKCECDMTCMRIIVNTVNNKDVLQCSSLNLRCLDDLETIHHPVAPERFQSSDFSRPIHATSRALPQLCLK